MSLSTTLRELRKKHNLTQKQLGELSGTSEITIRQYESGKYNPKMETLQKIANVFGEDGNLLMSQKAPQLISRPHTGELIRQLRCERGWKLEYLAQLLNVTMATISKYESNKIPIHADTLAKIANVFNVPVSYFFSYGKDIGSDESSNVILPLFDELNDIGKNKVIEYINDLSDNPKYKK